MQDVGNRLDTCVGWIFEDDTHFITSWRRELLLASIENSVMDLHVGFVVDDLAVHFHPCMAAKRNLAAAHHHLRLHARHAKQASSDRRTLQTERMLRVVATGSIDGGDHTR